MLRLVLLLLAVTTPINGILPDIVNSGINLILEDHSYHGPTETNNISVEMEHPIEEHEDTVHQKLNNNMPTGETDNDFRSKVNINATTCRMTFWANVKACMPIPSECVIDEDCERGSYCLYDTQNAKCLPCKYVDVLCTKDKECCDGQLCVWGQCSLNATKGEAGSLCQYQHECNQDLCCAVHKALLFPVCSAKPVERERCLGPSNHLTETVSLEAKGDGPTEHCPCIGDLQCQPLGRGSLCLKGQESSEEDLADSLYSEIDYIV